MTCDICQKREAVIFMVDTTERLKLRLCEPCDWLRRTASESVAGSDASALSPAGKSEVPNLIRLPEQLN